MDRGPSALSPEARDPRPRDALDGRRPTGARRARRRRRCRRRRHRPRRGHPRPVHRSRSSSATWPAAPASRSSKLIHGGLRYLEMLDFGLVREALRGARPAAHPAGAAPGPAGAVPLPADPHGWERPYVGAGLAALRRAWRWFGQVRHGRAPAPAPVPQGASPGSRRTCARVDLHGRDPLLRLPGRRRPAGAHVARTAAATAPTSRPGSRSTGFLREGERVVGVRAVDLEAGRELEVRARVVVNAAGVWTDEIQEMVGGRGALHVQASKGIHLVVPRDRIRSEAGLHRAHRDVGAVRDPVGPALDHRHHRHRLEPRQGAPGREPRRHRLRAGPRQRDPARAARPRRRRGRVRRAAAAARPASPSRPRGSPASTPWSRRCPAW